MNAVNWLLIKGANALLWGWGLIVSVLGAVWAVVDALLNPILSPVLTVLNPLCTKLGDGVYVLLAPLPVWLGLALLSAVSGVVLLVAFRHTSRQAAIGRARDAISANLLALKLYQDELRVAFACQWRLLRALARLQGNMLLPFSILLLPMVLVLAQMGLRYQWRPLRPGERTLITVRLDEKHADLLDAEIEPSPGLIVEAGPVPGGGALVWRVRAGQAGRHPVRLRVGDALVEKEVVVGNGFERVSPQRPGRHWTSQILYPVEPPLAADSPVESIEIDYGSVDSWIYGANWWLLFFFAVSMAFALASKPVFKVRF